MPALRMQSLRELQLDLQRHLLGQDSTIVDAIIDAPPLPAAARLGIYRNAYQVRLVEALDDTFPVVHKLLGDEMFSRLGESFVARYPSVYRSIRWYGAELAQFLAENAPYEEQPVLSEVALLEWTLAEVFDAADSAVIERSALAALPPDAWGELQFEFHPSVRRLQLLWNAVPVWRAMGRDETPPSPLCAAAPVAWVLWRKDLQNLFRSIENAEAGALDAALEGCSFGEICEVLREWLPDDEIPPAAANYLGVWADSGIIASLV
jgi:Putative DNA-binding domain